jgi:hypothetical protein
LREEKEAELRLIEEELAETEARIEFLEKETAGV